MAELRRETITVGDLAFSCLMAGAPDRPLLLFLHGFPEYSGGWEEMLTRLPDAYFCVAPDQRGYNLSSKPEGVKAYATGKMAADAAGILTHFAPRARAVIGHDWGASVAYAFAFARPDLFDKLVILNGAHPIPFVRAVSKGGAQSEASQYFHYLRSDQAEARLSADNYAKLAAMFAKGMDMDWLAGERLESYRAAWAQPGALTGMLNWYRATQIPIADPGSPIDPNIFGDDHSAFQVRMPHLLIWGLGDKALLPEVFEGLDEFCADLTVKTFEDADHWIIHQKPDDCAALIRDFVA